ncbi:MAG TPA: GntR family transcriptional regulator [Acidimicrobiales bacterium]|jgi:DNA-binding transcriptional regulator YhcF (GntR family)
MLVRVDATAAEALYLQIAAQLRAAIGKGDPGPGDQLPPARELAEGLGVNMHTVLRAYAELRDEGLVEMRRRRGVIVQDTGPGRARLIDLVRRATAEARRQGLESRDLQHLVAEVW